MHHENQDLFSPLASFTPPSQWGIRRTEVQKMQFFTPRKVTYLAHFTLVLRYKRQSVPWTDTHSTEDVEEVTSKLRIKDI